MCVSSSQLQVCEGSYTRKPLINSPAFTEYRVPQCSLLASVGDPTLLSELSQHVSCEGQWELKGLNLVCSCTGVYLCCLSFVRWIRVG